MASNIYEKRFKRWLDIVLATLGIVIVSPILILLALLIRLKLGKPILFKQPRPGLNEKIFTLYKFRTMKEELDARGDLLPDEQRLTAFGRFLRSTSLDELPSLFNILLGHMSFVGPRPLLVEYLPLYNQTQKQRHSVRPGLTGLAQVSGRNAITWEEKFTLDIEYVRQVSLLNDLRIITKTIFKVLKREDITSKSSATSEKFKGTDEK